MWYVYKVINTTNKKYYYGVRKCPTGIKPAEDEYMGSGILIKRAVKAHGKDSFEKLIIKTFTEKTKAYQFENELITLAEVKNQQCYNLRVGGSGGGMPGELNHNYGTKLPENSKKLKGKKISENWKDGKYEKAKKMWSEKRKGEGNAFYGKAHTAEYIQNRLELWAKKNGHRWLHKETGERYWTKKEAQRKLGRYQTAKLIRLEILVQEPYSG